MTMRVAALTQGRQVPAARFRVRQHIPNLLEMGVEVSEFVPRIDAYQGVPLRFEDWPKIARLPIVAMWQGLKVAQRGLDVWRASKFDAVWLQRELLPGHYSLERVINVPLVFDVDDAIWLTNSSVDRRISKLASKADVVIAGNQYIADKFSAVNDKVVIVPTAVDSARYSPVPECKRKRYTVGWIGTSSNLQYLQYIAPALEEFLIRHADAELVVISDKPPQLSGIPINQLRYTKWSESVEVSSIREMDVGIMPLPATEWAKGKCSYKMLQYMSCEIPVIVSPIGMNNEVMAMGSVGLKAMSNDEWFEALEYLFQDRGCRVEMGRNGRNVILQHYSGEVVSRKIAGVFKDLA